MEPVHEKHEHHHDEHHHEVKVTIDRIHRESSNPTTGAALYKLGEIKSGYDLWQETPGREDDRLVPDDNKEIHLHESEKFYSAQRTLNPGGK